MPPSDTLPWHASSMSASYIWTFHTLAPSCGTITLKLVLHISPLIILTFFSLTLRHHFLSFRLFLMVTMPFIHDTLGSTPGISTAGLIPSHLGPAYQPNAGSPPGQVRRLSLHQHASELHINKFISNPDKFFPEFGLHFKHKGYLNPCSKNYLVTLKYDLNELRSHTWLYTTLPNTTDDFPTVKSTDVFTNENMFKLLRIAILTKFHYHPLNFRLASKLLNYGEACDYLNYNMIHYICPCPPSFY